LKERKLKLMDEWAYFILGVSTCVLSFFLLKSLISNPEFEKKNYRNIGIPSLGGLVVLLSIIFAELFIVLLPESQKASSFGLSAFVIVFGFALIGLLDDLLGDKDKQGFKGHISELLKGRLTTGSLKLFGGPAIVLLAFSENIPANGYLNVIIDVICISLFANLFNLLDLSPGRTTKFALLTLIPMLLLGDKQVFMYSFLGIILLSLVFDIREKYMLGDTGSNLIGAIVGIAFVQAFNSQDTLFIAIGVLILNIISEFISFSRIIQGFLPLRIFEEIGQLQTRKSWAKERRQK